tara:strand:- start:87 stop:482 length:396 start_codon:yes stop_codon:yes gene_type:complete
MKVKLISIPVLNQDKALKFYVGKLGFKKNKDVSLGNENRWLTLISPEWKDGPELLLEPSPKDFKPSKVYQDALMEAGIPYTQFEVDSVDDEYKKLTKLGVDFSVKPTEMGTVKIAVFNDTCGNNIQIIQHL